MYLINKPSTSIRNKTKLFFTCENHALMRVQVSTPFRIEVSARKI